MNANVSEDLKIHTNNCTRPVTLKDVAERCRVHVMTVSRALRHDRKNLAEDTITRICNVAQEMGYNPESNHAARRLVGQRRGQWIRTRVLALFFPPLFASDNYANRILQGIMSVLTPLDYNLLLVPTYDPSIINSYREQLPSSFSRGEIDGALTLIHPNRLQILIEQMREEPNFGQRPIVSLMAPSLDCSSVSIDDKHGAYLAAKHLLSLGHRHILHTWSLKVDDIYFGPARYAGFCLAYHEFGINPEEFLHSMPCINDIVGIENRIRMTLPTALKQFPKTTAILASNDYMARVMCHYLTDAGIQIPDNISIIGFDDTYPMQQMNGQPFLSTIANPLEIAGREAAQLILRMLDSDTDKHEHIVLPVTGLIKRASTGPVLK